MARGSSAERRAVESRVVRQRWREIVAAWNRSDQDERKFCARQKIGVCALRWWVRRLADADDVEHQHVTDGARPKVEQGVPRAGRRRSRAEWVRLCAAWERSGLPPAEFCRELGLNVETLRWWRSQLRPRRARDAPTRLTAAVTGPLPRAASPTPTFVPVTVTPAQRTGPARSVRGSTIDVVLRGRRRVRVGPGVDEDFLARVVTVLEAIP